MNIQTNNTSKNLGFTLIELMITLSIISIIALFSSGSWSKFFAKQAVSTDVMSIVSTIQTAKNHSITHKAVTTICGYDNSEEMVSTDECLRDWSKLRVINLTYEQPEVIHTQQLKGNYEMVKWSAFQNKPQLEIAATGFTAHQNGTLYLCHKQFDDLHRSITVSKSGRIRVQKESTNLSKKCS